MNRVQTYVGQSIYEWLFSYQAQQSMVGLSKLSQAIFGTNTVATGLACTQTSTASMSVLVGAGQLYSMQSLEATVCGTLPADTTHTILKQGILQDAATVTLSAPSTAGQSIAYLIQATYADSDISYDPTTGTSNVVLQFYNATNPTTPYSGPNNNGLTSNTIRQGALTISAKAGVAATTGSQVTPSPDSGYSGLWVVTVPYGATTLTAANIKQYSASPILPASLLSAMQASNFTYAADTGTANAIAASYYPPITALTDGMVLTVNVANANTGGTTFSPNGLTAYPVVGAAHSALQGGEFVSGGRGEVMWDATLSSWVLLGSTGGATQVATATQTKHAVQFAQLTGVPGVRSTLKGSVAAGATTLTLTYDGLTVATSLTGLQYLLSGSSTLNLATTGAGGMDTGTATAGGWLAVYAIYNPTTGTKALLGQIFAAAGVPTTIYSGANMPSGYTASALATVVQITGATGQFAASLVNGRRVSRLTGATFSGSTVTSTATAISLSGACPGNATSVRGEIAISSTATSSVGMSLIADTVSGIGGQNFSGSAGTAGAIGNFQIDLLVQQTIYYTSSNTAGTPTYGVYITSFEF